jgi:hypothetical protein
MHFLAHAEAPICWVDIYLYFELNLITIVEILHLLMYFDHS